MDEEEKKDLTSNNLALTIRKEYHLTVISNVIKSGKRILSKISFLILLLNLFNSIL